MGSILGQKSGTIGYSIACTENGNADHFRSSAGEGLQREWNYEVETI